MPVSVTQPVEDVRCPPSLTNRSEFVDGNGGNRFLCSHFLTFISRVAMSGSLASLGHLAFAANSMKKIWGLCFSPLL